MSLETTPKAKAIRRLAVIAAELKDLLTQTENLTKQCNDAVVIDDANRESLICVQEVLYYKQAAESALARGDWEQLVELSQACCEKAANILVPMARIVIANLRRDNASDKADKIEHQLVKVLRPFTDILGAEKTKLS